ncbi:hypothetical protein OG864_00055 [Streptomyces sp. NBC_00124]|nr:hypothetical protein [Streptomyces sp. NBC_00124]MCX5357185.1 hypothetical protein [Streptomyces sp. NBC_00124]
MPEDQLSADQPADAAEEAGEAVVDDITDPGFAPDWQPTAGEYRLTTE